VYALITRQIFEQGSQMQAKTFWSSGEPVAYLTVSQEVVGLKLPKRVKTVARHNF
jgi:hypothetical protein